MIVGYFASRSGQFKCIDCDELGDFYQERPGETSCDPCPLNTQRYLNLLSATNRSACQCNSGACWIARPAKALGMVQAVVCRVAGYYHPKGKAGEVCPPPLRGSVPIRCQLYERGLLSVLQECAKCTGRKQASVPFSASLWGRTHFC
jgi:hypothetical protein